MQRATRYPVYKSTELTEAQLEAISDLIDAVGHVRSVWVVESDLKGTDIHDAVTVSVLSARTENPTGCSQTVAVIAADGDLLARTTGPA